MQALEVASQNLTPICNDGAGKFVGVVSLASDHGIVVSARGGGGRGGGLLQAWDRSSGRLVGAISVIDGSSSTSTSFSGVSSITGWFEEWKVEESELEVYTSSYSMINVVLVS